MKIVIIGGGRVGETLIEAICKEGHRVTVIDLNRDIVTKTVNKYDILGFVGNGADVSTQKEAGVAGCDLLIAATGGDELNLLCCVIGRNLGAKRTVSFLSSIEYAKATPFLSGKLGIDMLINPDLEAAEEIARVISFPAAMKVDCFAEGKVEVANLYLPQGHALEHLSLREIRTRFQTSVLICAVKRGSEVIIPDGNFVLQAGDSISITASLADMAEFFIEIGSNRKVLKKLMLIGGSRTAVYLAKLLLKDKKRKYRITIVEKDAERCEELSGELPAARIIHTDATDGDALIEEGIAQSDACIAVTGDDNTNIIISLFAKAQNVGKVITRISAPSFDSLLPTIGIESIVSPNNLSAAKVQLYLRSLKKRGEGDSKIKALYKIMGDRVEALEFDVGKDFPCLNIPLASPEMALKKNLLIATILRRDTIIYPNGQTTLEIGDSVVVVTDSSQRLNTLRDILA